MKINIRQAWQFHFLALFMKYPPKNPTSTNAKLDHISLFFEMQIALIFIEKSYNSVVSGQPTKLCSSLRYFAPQMSQAVN